MTRHRDSRLQRFGARVLALLLLGAVLGSGHTLGVQANPTRSDSYVKVGAKATRSDADGNEKVTVHLTIDKGVFIFANPVGNEGFGSLKTVVWVDGPIEEVKIMYPRGERDEDKVFVYRGQVDIEATFRRAAGDAGPLMVKVRFQAVKEGPGSFCLLPATVKLNVP